MTSAAKQAKKFNIDQFDVDGSSSSGEDAKFNTIDPPGMHDDDLNDQEQNQGAKNFGEAGTKSFNAPQKLADDSDEDEQVAATGLGDGSKPLTNPTMQASMFAREWQGPKGLSNKNKAGAATIKEEATAEQQKDNFTSISNVRATPAEQQSRRPNMMDTLENKQKANPVNNEYGLMAEKNKFQLATDRQWDNQPDKNSNEDQSARQSQASSKRHNVNDKASELSRIHMKDEDEMMQDYNTLQQVQSVNNKQDQEDDIVKRMHLEMQEDEQTRDVNPMDSQLGIQAARGKTPSTIILPNRLGKKKKVKGNMGLAITSDVVDPVQLNQMKKSFQEDDIFADEEEVVKNQKIRASNDFGMSSDEEIHLIKRNQAQKEAQDAEAAKLAKEAEQKRLIEEHERLRVEQERINAELALREEEERKARELAEQERLEQEKIAQEERERQEKIEQQERERQAKIEQEELEKQEKIALEFAQAKARLAEEDRQRKLIQEEEEAKRETQDREQAATAAAQAQVLSFENNQSNQVSNNVSQNHSLSAIVERPEETTEKKLVSGQMLGEDRDYSPNGLNTLRSNAKLIINNAIEEEPDKSALLNIENSMQEMSPKGNIQDELEQEEEQQQVKPQDISIKNPNFLGRIGAMIGMMKASSFVRTDVDATNDGRLATASRLGSASTYKSGRNNELPSQSQNRSRLSNNGGSVREQMPPQSSQSQQRQMINSRQSSKSGKQSQTSQVVVATPSKSQTRQSNRSRQSKTSRLSGQQRMDSPEEDEDDLIDQNKKEEFKTLEAERIGAALVLEPAEQKKFSRQNTDKVDLAQSQKLEEIKKEPKVSAVEILEQKRIENAIKKGKDPNNSYFEDNQSSENANKESEDPYNINQNQGYESSSTNHKVIGKSAQRLKDKVKQLDDGNTKTIDMLVEDPNYVDPEKDETHNKFQKQKTELLKQGIVLRKGDFNQLHPHSGKQASLDGLRFLGCFIYLTDLCMKIAYFRNTKWISTQIRDLWVQVFQLRIFFVLFYHGWFTLFSFQRSYYEYMRDRKSGYHEIQVQPIQDTQEDQEESEEKEDFTEEKKQAKLKEVRRRVGYSTLQRLCEITTQAFILPVTMYSGFSRLASLRDIKTNYLYISLGQELILHQLPLCVLFYYNNSKLDKPETKIDDIFFYVAIVHTAWVFLEMIFFRGYMNKGINLEQRIKHATHVRIGDMIRLGLIAGVIAAIFMMPAFMAFSSQECKSHYYSVGDHECHDCTDFHGEECVTCQDSIVCLECVQGHFLYNNECRTCASYWPGCVDCVFSVATEQELTGGSISLNNLELNGGVIDSSLRQLQQYEGGVLGQDEVVKQSLNAETLRVETTIFQPSMCLKAAHGFFFDSLNQVVSCKTIDNCEEGACGSNGCERCIDGYYLEDNVCYKCAIEGCSKCSGKTQCTECTSDFLQVQEDGSCKCNIGDGIFPHMSQDRYGSCTCEEGYWLTEFGCQTCQELIPDCEQCYRTSSNTLIALYEGANVGSFSRQYYVDCRTCPYHFFRQRASISQETKPSCDHCNTKWDGCGYCGSYGNRCTSCLESHVYNSRNYNSPCKPCWCWMGQCIWCQAQNKCVKYWSDSDPWPEYSLACD